MDPSLLARARAAWPDVALDDATFQAFLDASAAATGDTTDPAELDLPVLYLGCACVHGEPHALAAFEARYLDTLPRLVSRITTDPAVIDEVKQQLRIKLFVAEAGEVPRIAHYRRGSLVAWLRVVACRAAIDLLRQRNQPMVEVDERSLEHRALSDDPRLALLKTTYQEQVSRAFAAALAQLSATDRAMLRLCFIDELGLEEIGKIYQLSKSAISRRLSRSRETLLGDVKRRLRVELGIGDAELDSIMRMVTSQLHLSLPRLLR
jgi:RNA polymerase sigma-70 factor (ECF subfamily)